MCYGRMCRAQGEVTLMFSCRSDSAELAFWGLAVSGMRGSQPELQLLMLLHVLCSLEGSQALESGHVGSSSLLGQALSTVWQRCFSMSGSQWRQLILALCWLSCLNFELIPCASGSAVSLGTGYLDTCTQSVGVPAGLPCALLPGIKGESKLCCSWLISGNETWVGAEVWKHCISYRNYRTWCFDKDTFLASCANVLISPVHSAVQVQHSASGW